MLGLEVAAVEIVTADPRSSPAEQGAILEVEAAPDFQPSWPPASGGRGEARELGGLLVDRLAPADGGWRIPVAAITGTNGKTTTALLLTHLLELAGRRTGTATSDGLRIGGAPVMRGDLAGAGGARRVFCHPEVELAVLEVGCGGLRRQGLGFDRGGGGGGASTWAPTICWPTSRAPTTSKAWRGSSGWWSKRPAARWS